MADVSAAIGAFINNEISLTRKDISSAVESREWFIERVKSEIENRTEELVLYAPDPFIYFGSYFKGTKVKNVDEFDILVVIDSNTGVFSRYGQKLGVGQGNASPNHKYDNKYYKEDGSGVSPAKMLNWLKGIVKAVTSSFGGEAPIRNNQAVTAYIKSKDLKIDFVPAGIFKHTFDGSTFYNIPRGDASNGWIITSPRQDIELLKRAAKGKNSFRDVIRLCKYISSSYNFLVSSFAIESAIVQYGQNETWFNSGSKDLYLNVKGALSYLATFFRYGLISDPYDKNNNLIAEASSLSWYADRIDEIIAKLNSLQNEPNQTKAREYVSKIFRNE